MMLFKRLYVTNGCQDQYQGQIMNKLNLKLCLNVINIGFTCVFSVSHFTYMCVGDEEWENRYKLQP